MYGGTKQVTTSITARGTALRFKSNVQSLSKPLILRFSLLLNEFFLSFFSFFRSTIRNELVGAVHLALCGDMTTWECDGEHGPPDKSWALSLFTST